MERYDSMDGQVALVTGATRGIGERIAARLDERGAAVYAGARDPTDVTAGEQGAVELDVTDDGTFDRAAGRIADEAGGLDVLVNNAGIAGPKPPLHETGVEGIDATLDVNLRGPVLLARRALPTLLERRGGRVVNVSSGMGALGEGTSGAYGPYRVSKPGLDALTVYLHGEYADEGLIANSACPGWVDRPRVAGGAEEPRRGGRHAGPAGDVQARRHSGRFWRDRERIERWPDRAVVVPTGPCGRVPT